MAGDDLLKALQKAANADVGAVGKALDAPVPPSLKEQLSKIKTAQIGDRLYIFDDSTEADVRKLIVPDGHGAKFGSGFTEWIIDEPIIDVSKQGSDQYQWDKTGNRVKHNRVKYIKDRDGNITKTVVRTVFKNMD